jgi:hypothetical protein
MKHTTMPIRPALGVGEGGLADEEVAALAVGAMPDGLVAHLAAARQQLGVAGVVHGRFLGAQVAGGWAAEHVQPAAAGELLPGAVDVEIAVVAVQHGHGQGAAGEQRTRQPQLGAQLGLGLHEAAHVGRAAHPLQHRVAEAQRHDGDFVAAGLAVGGDPVGAGVARAVVVAGVLEHRVHRGGAAEQLVQRSPEGLCHRLAAELGVALVDEGHAAARIGAEQQVLHAADDGAELAFAVDDALAGLVEREHGALAAAQRIGADARQHQQGHGRGQRDQAGVASAGQPLAAQLGARTLDDDDQRPSPQRAEGAQLGVAAQAGAAPDAALGALAHAGQRRTRRGQRHDAGAGQVVGAVGGGEQLAIQAEQGGCAVVVVERDLLEVGDGVRVEQGHQQGLAAAGQLQRAQQRDEAHAGRQGGGLGITLQARQAAGRDEAAHRVGVDLRPRPQGLGWQQRAPVGRVGGGDDAPAGVHQGHAAQEGQAGLGLAEQGLQHLGRAAAHGHVGQAAQGEQRGVDAARGVVFKHACQQGLALARLGQRRVVVAHEAVGRAQHHHAGEQGAGRGNDAAGPPAGAMWHQCVRTMAVRPWRLAAASRRPSRWMRATNSSTVASQAASPGLTA